MVDEGLQFVCVEGINAYIQKELNNYTHTPNNFSPDQIKENTEVIKQFAARITKHADNPHPENPYHMQLFNLAKEKGVYIIGIDYPQNVADYLTLMVDDKGNEKEHDIARAVLMNYQAVEIINRRVLPKLEKGKKFICLVGLGHTRAKYAHGKTRGIAELTNLPLLSIYGTKKEGFSRTALVHEGDVMIFYENDSEKQLKEKDDFKQQ